MSFATVVQPALECADGFPTTDVFALTLHHDESLLRLWPNSVAFLFHDGRLPERGEIFRQPSLTKTLRELIRAEHKTRGSRTAKIEALRDYFYRGPIAKRMGEFSEANGGIETYSDIASFHAEIDKPRTTTYRGYEIVKPGFWTQGPVLLEMLNLVEGYDLKSMQHNSPEYLHILIEAAKLAFADRDQYYGDPKFSKIPEEPLLSESYANERRKLIDPRHASMESRPGQVGGRYRHRFRYPPAIAGHRCRPSERAERRLTVPRYVKLKLVRHARVHSRQTKFAKPHIANNGGSTCEPGPHRERHWPLEQPVGAR